ncbi:MAG: hypothetical protein EBU57_05060 [Alphaproteobacteria bacterium]|nr:hypothetical protein [Alphaproteobacteria bacterium]
MPCSPTSWRARCMPCRCPRTLPENRAVSAPYRVTAKGVRTGRPGAIPCIPTGSGPSCQIASCRAKLIDERPDPVTQPAIGAGRNLGYTRPGQIVVFESPLVTRNVNVGGRRTSVRLEPDLWEALREIALRENRTLHDICSDIDKTRGETRLTSAMRIYIVNYYRSAANPT